MEDQMVNRDLQIVMEIRNIILNMRGEGFYDDSTILDSIDGYIKTYLDKTVYNNKSWRVAADPNLERDIREIDSCRELADKYNITYQCARYYKKSRGLPTIRDKRHNKC
jgi:hypothetical protein